MGCLPNVGLLVGGLIGLWLVSQVAPVVVWIAAGVLAVALVAWVVTNRPRPAADAKDGTPRCRRSAVP